MKRFGRLWRKFQTDPTFTRHLTGWLILISIAEWIVAGFVGWVNSVAYVSHLSQLAITISLIPWWQGTRVEERQANEDIPNEVADKLIARTDIVEEAAG